MHPQYKKMNTYKPGETRSDTFSLTSTLEHYEVREIEAHQIAALLAQDRRGFGFAEPSYSDD